MAAQTQFSGGFQNAPVQAAHAFRAAMTVMARPGDIRTLTGSEPPAPLSVAAGTLLLTLCDPETKVHLASDADTDAVRKWLTFHTGAPIVSADQADFAVGTWGALGPLNAYRIGTPEYPDRSATLIVECDQLEQSGAILSGPGIKDTARLSLPDVPALQGNAMLYPLGCDFFFTCGDRIAALPRSTQIRTEG
ncbi:MULTISPECIES: phosphonate C-P lyase system protein PhnH [unclassified Ruegeria]|uniref:phosphonate C-P lyase system protein PhnH n=1 Tax=unclassified Ruegeria TaxID=2625375 RepID=UPI001487C398|nr:MULTISPECIES: phosphonate C-P lyase system protein PhnH [unclassified Ruegeria]NOD77250.1 phosphonate C-P lyase system protein PhnH [Ruegeria sp. HKCCD4332]NOD89721.1 phosphonate C-P lyase system protein PhnH [Ruegeria sp. HKCCD4318]NOE14044.1 phosphonate C-P lyase system protein PhnH [Ruegeria sp. HKCCD4318-2]NOG08019.1 phosphonate C-P lyase system protein PhnH [Ruegeria sp. HKCCD4315]